MKNLDNETRAMIEMDLREIINYATRLIQDMHDGSDMLTSTDHRALERVAAKLYRITYHPVV